MKAVIESYCCVPDLPDNRVEAFHYCLYGDCGMLHRGTVTIRTANVLATEIRSGTAFSAMMRAISEANPRNHDSLVGATFFD